MTAVNSSRVLFDAYWWISGPTSLRNVVRSVVSAWSAQYPEDELTLSIRAHEADDLRAQLASADIRAEILTVPRSARFHALGARSLGRLSDGFDAVITQNFAARTRGARSSVLVHDAMFVEHPEWFSFPERVYLSRLRPTLRDADVIFTTSQTESDRVARVWPEVADRVLPVGLAVPEDLSRAAAPPTGRDRRSAVHPRGRAPEHPQEPAPADRCGPRGSRARRISDRRRGRSRRARCGPRRLGAQRDRVRFLERVGDPELNWLYANCAVFAFPSLDEGFGLPLIEARAVGARIAASDIPVFRELGPADAWFDPLDTRAIASGLRAALAAPRPGRIVGDRWADVVGRMRPAALGPVPADVSARG